MFLFAFLCVSEHFKSIETHFFFSKNFCEHEVQNVRKRSEQDASVNMLRQTVTLATAIFLFSHQHNLLHLQQNIQETLSLLDEMLNQGFESITLVVLHCQFYRTKYSRSYSIVEACGYFVFNSSKSKIDCLVCFAFWAVENEITTNFYKYYDPFSL